MNRRKFLSYVGCGCCGFVLNSCSTAPITERRQLNIIPDSIGWLGNQISHRIGSWSCYEGNFDSSSWFPSKTIGEHWQNFSTSLSTDTSVCDLTFDSSYVFFNICISKRY